MACAKKEKSLEQLADEGDSVAQYEMGRQFYVGDHGRPRDLLMAYQWFVRAAEAGDTGAQNTLGVMLQNGQGVGADLDRAREWYQRAADAGHPKAQSNLGHLYAMGIGVEKNIVQAYQWFALAAAGGDPQGQSNLAVVAVYHRGGIGCRPSTRAGMERAASIKRRGYSNRSILSGRTSSKTGTGRYARANLTASTRSASVISFSSNPRNSSVFSLPKWAASKTHL